MWTLRDEIEKHTEAHVDSQFSDIWDPISPSSFLSLYFKWPNVEPGSRSDLWQFSNHRESVFVACKILENIHIKPPVWMVCFIYYDLKYFVPLQLIGMFS